MGTVGVGSKKKTMRGKKNRVCKSGKELEKRRGVGDGGLGTIEEERREKKDGTERGWRANEIKTGERKTQGWKVR